MTYINILVPLLLLEFTVLLAAFPTMAETARKSSREARMFSFSSLALEGGAVQLADFIERYYTDNKVVTLKMAKGALITIVLSASLFFLSGYYASTSVVPKVKDTAKQQLGMAEDNLKLFETSLNELPDICFRVASTLSLLVLVMFGVVAYYYELPHDLSITFNPPRPITNANQDKRQVADTNDHPT